MFSFDYQNCRRIVLKGCLAAGVLLAACSAAAGQPYVPESYLTQEQVFQRLLQAEARIQQLETQQSSVVPLPPLNATSIAYDNAEGEEAKKQAEEFEALTERVSELEDAAKKASKPKPVIQKWTGRIHTDYWGFPEGSPLVNQLEGGDPDSSIPDRFTFRRVRFGVAGSIYETMEYKIEMEFADPNDTAFKDVYIGWNELPFLQTVLLGIQKRPYGLDHLNSSRYNVFLERPYVIEAFNQDARRLGLCSYGVSESESWNWRYGVYLTEDISGDGDYTADAYQMELAGRLANTIWYDDSSDGRGYAHWAVSGTIADPSNMPMGGAKPTGFFTTRPEARTNVKWFDTGTISDINGYELIGLEGVINLGAFSIVAEYQRVFVQRGVSAPDVDFGGGYVYIAYWLTGEHTPWERDSGTLGRTKPFENFFLVPTSEGLGTGWGAWQVAARYSHGDFTDNDILGGVGNSLTFGVNWWWTPNSRMQFNYIHGEIDDRYAAGPIPAGTPGTYDIFGSRFMVDF